jgi:geranylgeranyl diphosphate synthase type II
MSVSGATSESTFDFKTYTASRRALVEERLQNILDEHEPKVLWDSMRYSVLSGGKRLRALVCLAAAEAVSKSKDALELAMACACAIELIHAMSLIHDDLPALDNDDFRRGKPTNHKVFGEAMALLAGDALLMLATEVLINRTPSTVDRSTLLAVVLELTRAAGASGMVGGQVADMQFTGSSDQFTSEILESIHRRKTGAIIRFSLWSGAKLAGADDKQLNDLTRFGEILGLAFQITDDLLDVTGDISTLGKTPGKDEAAQKATWVRVFGVEGSKARLLELEDEGRAVIKESNIQPDSMKVLSALLEYAIHRVN